MVELLVGTLVVQPRVANPGLGLRIDVDERVVEFDGRVALDAHDPETPLVFLELLVCAPDTREHEAVVVTDVKASVIHAALLAVGIEHGEPGRVVVSADGVERVVPTGDPVRVEFVVGEETFAPRDWVGLEGGEAFDEALSFVFAGSRMVERRGRSVYDAEGTGVIVGLTTFGSEVVALEEVVSPESTVDAPSFVVRTEMFPAFGQAVTVRLSVVDEDGDGEGDQ